MSRTSRRVGNRLLRTSELPVIDAWRIAECRTVQNDCDFATNTEGRPASLVSVRSRDVRWIGRSTASESARIKRAARFGVNELEVIELFHQWRSWVGRSTMAGA